MRLDHRMDRIYRAIEEPIIVKPEELYQVSLNNSREANDLRALLLQVYNDQKLAKYLGHTSVRNHLYDPNPNLDHGEVLGWREDSNRVQFIHSYFDDDKPRFNKESDFELYEERFYAKGGELVDIFPKLTTDILEESILKQIQEEKNREKKELLLQEKRRKGY